MPYKGIVLVNVSTSKSAKKEGVTPAALAEQLAQTQSELAQTREALAQAQKALATAQRN